MRVSVLCVKLRKKRQENAPRGRVPGEGPAGSGREGAAAAAEEEEEEDEPKDEEDTAEERDEP